MPVITLPLRALSVNQITKVNYKQKRVHKSTEAYAFRKAVNEYLDIHGDELRLLAENFVDHKHCFIVDTTFYFPADDLLAKPRLKNEKRRLSNRVGDTDNYLKWTIDCIWDWIGVDDRFIIDHTIKKRPSMATGSIHADIQMVELSSISEYSPFL